MSLLKTFVTVVFFLLSEQINAQNDFQSPCPRLFVYEAKQNESDKWYGTVTLLSEADLSGIWLRLIFDRASLQLGNWFGEVKTTDNQEYLIENRDFHLKANVPEKIEFYLQYDPQEQIPKLTSFRLNARTICPEQLPTDTSPAKMELQTSNVGAVSPPRGNNNGFQSPCPRLFVYETRKNEPGKWYGIVTLLSEADLSGVWLRLIFDRTSLQLDNSFGEVETTNNQEYLIENRNFHLKANVPQTIEFYVRYDPHEPIPKLISFRLNGRTVCPG
ncbi:hypothetical protein ILUMI_20747 [Ignelater luminosus]|uniref:Serine protease gd N-terminal domain-containing protein n=1 Tax=Ignelater luminosus TaxID=2038154 RepID=A0A8K0CHQ8_IGNLU|nr:hypothetical protein ILUMI_20747 [Ignelater luminosus]